MEFRNKNDYSVIIFFEDKEKKPFKMEFVHSLYSLTQWLSKSPKFNDWHYINVYVRRSGRYINRYYKGNFIPNKPR